MALLVGFPLDPYFTFCMVKGAGASSLLQMGSSGIDANTWHTFNSSWHRFNSSLVSELQRAHEKAHAGQSPMRLLRREASLSPRADGLVQTSLVRRKLMRKDNG